MNNKRYYKGAIHRFAIDEAQVKRRGENSHVCLNLYKEDLFRIYDAFPGVLKDYLMRKGYV